MTYVDETDNAKLGWKWKELFICYYFDLFPRSKRARNSCLFFQSSELSQSWWRRETGTSTQEEPWFMTVIVRTERRRRGNGWEEHVGAQSLESQQNYMNHGKENIWKNFQIEWTAMANYKTVEPPGLEKSVWEEEKQKQTERSHSKRETVLDQVRSRVCLSISFSRRFVP